MYNFRRKRSLKENEVEYYLSTFLILLILWKINLHLYLIYMFQYQMFSILLQIELQRVEESYISEFSLPVYKKHIKLQNRITCLMGKRGALPYKFFDSTIGLRFSFSKEKQNFIKYNTGPVIQALRS